MKCPFCGYPETSVVDSRESSDGFVVRRRRECPKCGKRFTTYERIETNIVVIKKDGRRESFDREKLKTGILKACEKRPVSLEDVDKMVTEIEATLRSKGPEVSSKEIGNLVMKKLKKVDKVAYIRFASVYKEFADIEDFKNELLKLSGGVKNAGKKDKKA